MGERFGTGSSMSSRGYEVQSRRGLIDSKLCLRSPQLNVMNFLNEVVLQYPRAISFAPGRPHEEFFHVEEDLLSLERWVRYRQETTGASREDIFAELGQYHRTNGIVNDLVARQLELDEGIHVDPDGVMLTVGAQEAMLVLLLGLFEPGRDVLLCSDPTYIGITGPASIIGVEVVPVASGPRGLTATSVERALREVRGRGRRARALYDIPDFNNPMGTTMPEGARRELLDLAASTDLLVFEDNPYGMFAYDGERVPTLRALDEAGVVVYIGSFAKSVCPGLRLGYLVADQRCAPDGVPLAVELSKVKSLTTVTTSPILQAILGGILLEDGGSLRPRVAEKLAFYRANRDHMLERLGQEFGVRGLAGQVTWNRPAGGFFVTMTLPFEFDEKCLQTCAAEFGVIVCPMTFFSLESGRENLIRLSFSYVNRAQIEEGLARLARFVHSRMD